jgi:trehalose/maltose transport system substrate-binding protein
MKTRYAFGFLLVFMAIGCARPSPQPVTLTYLDVEWDAPDALPDLAEALDDFTRQTGIRIRRLPRADDSHSRLIEWENSLRNGASSPDVVSIDVIWPPLLSQFLVDLKPYLSEEISSQDAAVVDSYTVDGRTVAIPHHAYVGVLFYRPDLLRRYGYRAPPRTWDELEAMAARIQKEERARGNRNFWGYVWQGATDEDLTCSGLEWQVSEGGGRNVERDKTISVNNPQTIKSWERAQRWIGSISPPSVVAYRKWDSHNLWGSGNAMFLRSWQSDYSIFAHGWPFSGARSISVNEFGMTSMPGGRAGRAATLGGNGLGIARASTHFREALELVRFLAHRDAQQRRDDAHLALPRGLELFEVPQTFAKFAERHDSEPSGARLAVRPSIEAGTKYEDVTTAYIRELHSVLMRKKIPSVAVADLERELVAITGFRTGAPDR